MNISAQTNDNYEITEMPLWRINCLAEQIQTPLNLLCLRIKTKFTGTLAKEAITIIR